MEIDSPPPSDAPVPGSSQDFLEEKLPERQYVDSDYQAPSEDEAEEPPAEWDLDTDDVRSISSTELYENRPNRWRGKPSTWRELTEQDRMTYNAFISLRNQDLALHLYNAFALKHRKADDEQDDEDIDMVTGERVRANTDWVPPRSWTAWPMRAHLVPREGLMPVPAPGDPHEVHTVRRAPQDEEVRPGAELEDLVCATMLKFAKDKFRRRQLSGQVGGGEGLHGYVPPRVEDPVTPQRPKDRGRGEENDDDDDEWPGGVPPSGQGSPVSNHSSRRGETGDDDDDDGSPPRSREERREAKRTFTPAFSADDERSYALLQPAARRIMDKLAGTLVRLHEARVRCLQDQEELSETSGSEAGMSHSSRSRSASANSSQAGRPRDRSEVRTPKHNKDEEPVKRKRGRPRSTAPPKIKVPKPEYGPGGKKRAGRPRKTPLPLPGETEREMLVRVAKERHERVPVFSDDDMEGETSAASDQEEENTKGRKGKRKGRAPPKTIERREGETDFDYSVRVARARHQKVPVAPSKAAQDDEAMDLDPPPPSRSQSQKAASRAARERSRPPPPADPRDKEYEAEERIQQKKASNPMRHWPLRDWSDVVGAAALAGFPAEVVARTAQRCADLFGQGMSLHTILEMPADAGDSGVRTATFLPRASGDDDFLLPIDSISSSDEAEEGIRTMRMRSLSREPSLAPHTDISDEDSSDEEEARGRKGSSRARSTGRSRTPGPSKSNMFFCPRSNCPRSVRGFDRRTNMERHVALVHDKQDGGLGGFLSAGGKTSDGDDRDGVDSLDEMDGAVHVDGFLKPIKVRKGWRAEDMSQRPARTEAPRGKKRGRMRARDDEEDGAAVEYGDDSS